MMNKKNMLLLFVGLIVLCLTVSAVAAANETASDTTDTQTTQIQKTNEQTNTIETQKASKQINKTTTSKDKKSATTYYVATNGKASNDGTKSKPYDLSTAVDQVRKDKGGNLILAGGTYPVSSYIGFTTAGTYTLSGENGKTVTLNGQGKTRILWVTEGTSLEIKNIVFSNGKEGGLGAAIRKDGAGSLKVTNCKFTNNQASNGGAIYTSSALTVKDSTFTNNKATGSGAAIHTTGANTQVIGSTFTNNKADALGGAVYTSGNGLTVSGNTFTQNSAQSGGAVNVYKTNQATITKNTFTKNTATSGGAAVYTEGNNHKITDNVFTQNSAPSAGAILNIRTANTVITGNKFTQNTATNGAGGAIVDNGASSTTISKNSFSQNTAKLVSQNTGNGGAIVVYADSSKTTITYNNFTSNKAEESGAGISLASPNSVISNNNFIQNTANHGSGAVYIETNNVKVTNNYINKQTVPGDGAGVYIRGSNCIASGNTMTENKGRSGTLYFDGSNNQALNNVITNNVASQAGAGIYSNNNAGTIIRSNTICDNTASNIGGGIALNMVSKATIISNRIVNNKASKTGGAIAVNQASSSTIAYNTIASNSAQTNGGAVIIYAPSSYVTVRDNNFISNVAKNSAGAIMTDGSNNQISTNNFISNVATAGWGGAISSFGTYTKILNNKFMKNTAKCDYHAIRDYGKGSTINNNVNAGGSKCYGTVYNSGQYTTIQSNTFQDTVPAVKTTTVMNKVSGTFGQTITLTANVRDTYNLGVNTGTVIFKANGANIKGGIAVKNGVASFSYKAPASLNGAKVTAVYSGASGVYYASTSSAVTAAISKGTAKVTVSVSPASQSQYKTITFKAKVVDSATNKAIANNAKNLVTFKINGAAVKDSKGKVVQVKVVNGIATYKYTVPAGAEAYTKGNKLKSYTVTATLSSPQYNGKANNAKFTLKRSNVKIVETLVKHNSKQNKLVLKLNIVDTYKKKNIVGTCDFFVRVNGKIIPYKGSSITKIKNGKIAITLDLPSSMKTVKTVKFNMKQNPAYNGYIAEATSITRV